MTREKTDEVLILGHNDDIRLASGKKDLRIRRASEAEVSHCQRNNVEAAGEPFSQTRRKLFIEPESHAARTG